MDKLLFKRIIFGLLIVFIVAYLVFLIVSANFARSLETEEAVSTDISDVIHTNAFIIRDEHYIENNEEGVLSFNVSDGDDVSSGQTIADIYNSESDAVNRKQIKSLNEQINKLRTLSENYYKDSVGLDTINTQINNNIFTIMGDVNNGKFSEAKTECNNLLLTICARQMTTGNVKDFSSKIIELRRQREKLEANCSARLGTLSSSKAGYFISNTDGYEKSVSIKNLDRLSLSKYKKIKKTSVASNVVGKVVTSPEWYIACEITADDAVMLAKLQNKGSTIHVTMPALTTEKIPTKIHSINQRSKKDKGVLVLSCDYMNNYLSNARKEGIEIITMEYSGLKVSKRAIHEAEVKKTVYDKKGNKSIKKKTVQGVYVLHGSELVFKQIDITYSSTDFVLCNPKPDEGVLFNGETLKLYDQVVIKGDDLFDGKVIK